MMVLLHLDHLDLPPHTGLQLLDTHLHPHTHQVDTDLHHTAHHWILVIIMQ